MAAAPEHAHIPLQEAATTAASFVCRCPDRRYLSGGMIESMLTAYLKAVKGIYLQQ
jgi:hypothetical protein